MKKKVVIIEDEPAAVNELQILIQETDDLQLLGEAGTLDRATDLIRNQRPDLVFMDINLYDCDAFDILDKLEHMPKHIIFVTAYDQYAIKAIKYGALDYLLKPIDAHEFKDAVDRFRSQIVPHLSSREQIVLAKETLHNERKPQHIALPSLGEVRIVPLADIRYCQGDGPYTHFMLTSGKKETVSKPLKFYETVLPKEAFIRTHQSYIIHIAFVKSVLKHTSVLMDRDEEIPISHRRKNDILARLIR